MYTHVQSARKISLYDSGFAIEELALVSFIHIFSSSSETPDDYTMTVMTVTFPAGETQMSVTVPTTEDDTAEETEMFTAVLSDPTNGLTLGDDSTARAMIEDNDGR